MNKKVTTREYVLGALEEPSVLNKRLMEALLVFLTVAGIVLSTDLQEITYQALQAAGLYGAIGIIANLVLKAIFEGLKALLVWAIK